MRKKSSFFDYIISLLFLISICAIPSALSDEILTSDGKRYKGVIINQSPEEVIIRLEGKTIKIKRSGLKYLKKWTKEQNDALIESWKSRGGEDNNLDARKAELKFADSVRYSDTPWQIYEEDVFIAFHNEEGIIRSRLKGKVGDYCKKIAEKFGYDEFKLYDKSNSPDWNLKLKFYSYRSFERWRKATEAVGFSPSTAAAFASGNRRVFFYELNMKEDIIYHEIAHNIYHEFTRNATTPEWWNEGIAQYALLTAGEARRLISRSRFRALNNKHISLLSADTSYDHIYGDGLSVVYFLVREAGRDKFKKFNYNLRERRDFEKALRDVYGFKDIVSLEKAWVEFLKKTDVKDITGD